MVLLSSGAAVSTAAYTKGSNLIQGTANDFVSKGVLSLWSKPSATGLYVSLKINGVAIIDDQPLMAFGTAGTLSKVDNLIVQQAVAGGRVELFFRNSTANAITCDYQLDFQPTK